jgi:Flp pilus assembly secretin CpaC
MQAPKLTCFNGQKATVDVTDKQTYVTGVEMVSSGDTKIPQPKTTTVSAGVQFSVQPVVMPDNRNVTLNLNLNITRMDSPEVPLFPVVCTMKPEGPGQNGKPLVFTQFIQKPRFSTFTAEKSLKMTGGSTALLTGWTHQREVRNEIAPPLLGKIPYVGQLFKTVALSSQKEHLMVMATPRIITLQEEEEKATVASKVTPASLQIDSEEGVKPAVKVKAPVVYSSNRSFRLSYDLGNASAWQDLGSVEVWYTRDAQKWERYPEQVKPIGSIPVTVRTEGRWGFTVIARGKGGQSGSAPSAGDEPQVWIEVGKGSNPEVVGIPSIRAVTVQPRD